MSSGKQVCRNCKYENTSKRISSNHPDYPGAKYDDDYAIWCNKLSRYIGGSDRHNAWCSSFKHY